MTALLFRDDAYLKTSDAKIIGVTETGGLILDQTIFYATAGGQPGDSGKIETAAGSIAIATTIYDENKTPIHVPAEGQERPNIGESVKLHLDWESRYRNMRCHSLLHLLSAAAPFPVAGGAMSADGGRIDFAIPDGQVPEKQALTDMINAWITEDHAITSHMISETELDAKPELVRTLSVKPPRGSGMVRLVLIGADGKIDRQPCGGTHVNSTAEIGPIVISKIENKSRNKRIRIAFA